MSTSVPLGQSTAHRTVISSLAKVAPTVAEVLISGPTGVGKELYAAYVHNASPRRNADFVPVNCSGLSNDLLENELFGHVSGAFTGARENREGLVKAAQHGTLFLDEVDSLPLGCQAKLLRFIQAKEYRRLGETRTRQADVRIVAATNADLLGRVREGRFREDLYFRLRVIPVFIPPLAERPDDIDPLLSWFVVHYAKAYRLPPVQFSAAALRCLRSYSWPGNVRELENCVRFLTCQQLDREVEVDDLPLLSGAAAGGGVDEPGKTGAAADYRELTRLPLKEAKRTLVSEFERHYLQEALRRSGGNITRAAGRSGKPRRAFFELMRKYGIDAASHRESRVPA